MLILFKKDTSLYVNGSILCFQGIRTIMPSLRVKQSKIQSDVDHELFLFFKRTSWCWFRKGFKLKEVLVHQETMGTWMVLSGWRPPNNESGGQNDARGGGPWEMVVF